MVDHSTIFYFIDMTSTELRVFERIAKNLENIDDSIKSLNETIKKTTSNTNRSTILYKMVDSIGDVSKSVNELRKAQIDTNKTITDNMKK